MNRKYSPEMRERALRMLAETRPSHPTMMSAVRHVAGLLGMSPETLRLWQRRYEVDAGTKPGLRFRAALPNGASRTPLLRSTAKSGPNWLVPPAGSAARPAARQRVGQGSGRPQRARQ